MKTLDIKVWMLKKGIRQMDIARDLNISPQMVWQVLHDVSKSKRVIEWLQRHGCPKEFLKIEGDYNHAVEDSK